MSLSNQVTDLPSGSSDFQYAGQSSALASFLSFTNAESSKVRKSRSAALRFAPSRCCTMATDTKRRTGQSTREKTFS